VQHYRDFVGRHGADIPTIASRQMRSLLVSLARSALTALGDFGFGTLRLRDISASDSQLEQGAA
jgi:hypothetical protein